MVDLVPVDHDPFSYAGGLTPFLEPPPQPPSNPFAAALGAVKSAGLGRINPAVAGQDVAGMVGHSEHRLIPVDHNPFGIPVDHDPFAPFARPF